MLLVTAEEMREIDRQTIEGVGIPGIVLMENAGRQVAEHIIALKGKKAKAVILAGHGNNGGDGFVVARYLGNSGYQVETWLIGDIQKCSKDCISHFHALVHSGYRVKFWSENNNDMLKERLQEADVIVDALLGTGTTGGLREPIKSVVEMANAMNALRIAVDIPTGVNSDTGAVENSAFNADSTVTFALPKLGQYLYPGADYIGNLVVADISIPPIIFEYSNSKKFLINYDTVKKILPRRKRNSHKGTYGHALLIGGSKGMPGAPSLSTMAALRSGAGLTTIAVPESIQSMVFSHSPEAICLGLPETDTGHLSLKSIDSLNLEGNKYDAIGIGPGLGIWEQGREWILRVLKYTTKPLVIDADGLNLLADDLSPLKQKKGTLILTPHPGEMARLIKKDIKYVEQNRIKVASGLAIEYEIYVVLKGANTIIATPDGEIYLNTTGGPELSKGGTGDILTGMITAFLAQGITIKDALKVAVYLHGLAGTLASFPSNYSTLATDVIDKIGLAINDVISNNAE